jgi:uncharacterized UBP type Zn finger protein
LQAPDVPAGLRNLGNTCYVNAAMQFLHSLPAFRSALYKLEPELAGQQIVKQMRSAGNGHNLLNLHEASGSNQQLRSCIEAAGQ